MTPSSCVMLEVCSIRSPKDFTEMRSYIVVTEDLLPVLQYYSSCSNRFSNDLEAHKRSMMDEYVFDIIANTAKNRKRQCNIVYDH